jgi:hypothetical protein
MTFPCCGQLSEMTQAERGALMAQILEQHPHLIEIIPERLRAVSE